jgi:hypothetical protein
MEISEFWGPGPKEALDQADAKGTRKVIGVTPMMTFGGEHFEVDIPPATRRARERYPEIPISYAWPVDVDVLAQFLAAQKGRLVSWTTVTTRARIGLGLLGTRPFSPARKSRRPDPCVSCVPAHAPDPSTCHELGQTPSQIYT